MQGPETRPSLIGSLADTSSQSGWSEFVRLYQPAIYRVAQLRGLQPADAEDLTQDVLAKVSHRIKGFDPLEKGSFRGWLGKITRDMIVDRFRRRVLDAGSGDSAAYDQLAQIPSPEETSTLIRTEVRRERLSQACDTIRCQFSEPVWMSFWLTAIEQRPISQVARMLNKSEGAVRVARCRVMNRLKEELRDDDF